MQALSIIGEHIISEAALAGKLQNLPLDGQPLDLTEHDAALAAELRTFLRMIEKAERSDPAAAARERERLRARWREALVMRARRARSDLSARSSADGSR
jgi:hypothetical protein